MSIWRQIHKLWNNFRISNISQADVDFIRSYLNPQEQIIFYRMSSFDQRHCLDVAYLLKIDLEQDSASHGKRLSDDYLGLKAALLHDVGKVSLKFKLSHRIWYVVLGKITPKRLWSFILKLGNKEKSLGFFKAMSVLSKHPQIGSYYLKKIQTEPLVCEFVRNHQTKINLADHNVLNLLKKADDQ